MELRDYQFRALAEVDKKIQAGSRRPLLVSPTGSGKTRMAEEFIARHGPGALWVAHRQELLAQAPACSTPVSIQTLLARPEYRPSAGLVVLDEARHYIAPEFRTIASSYPNAIVLGLDATPERSDGGGLGEMFDSITVAATIAELTKLGFLVPCDVIGPSKPLRSGQLAARPVDAYLEHARGQQAIVFCAHVKAAEQDLADFLMAGVRAALITGESRDREVIIARFKRGEIDVLVNVYVLTEGFDHPPTSCAILARGCTAGMYLQIVGRVLRPWPGKRRALLIDLRGMSNTHGAPAEDRIFSLVGRPIRRWDDHDDDGRLCKVCGFTLDQPGPCPECGTSSAMLMPKIVVSPLVKYAAKRAEPEDKRIRSLAKWMNDGAEKGHKPGAALGKFRAVYGNWPDHPTRNKAFALTKVSQLFDALERVLRYVA